MITRNMSSRYLFTFHNVASGLRFFIPKIWSGSNRTTSSDIW